MEERSWRGWRRVSFWGAVTLLSACIPDDQTSIKPDHLPVANPAPVSTSGRLAQFAENNAKHKILLGVFDTGVDYNHPYLRDSIHFQLDEQGRPVGAGLDFLSGDGEDVWASPRVIKTSSYEFEFLSKRQQKKAIDTFKAKEAYNNEVRRKRMGEVCAAESLLSIDPRLEKYLHPYRSLDVEKRETEHGTHVAGLMSYDNPAIGLVPYRMLPYHQTDEDEANEALGKADKFVINFEKALEHARKNGIKIVNLSLGGSFERPTNSNSSTYEAELEKYNNYKRLLTEGITVLVKKYSEILFVAAAGNDSGWSDNEARLQYPCGVEASNILCVGALNKDGTLAKFTNLPLNKIDLVLASGVKIISTIPSDNCKYLTRQFDLVLTGGTNGAGLCQYSLKDKKWVRDLEFADRYRSLISTLYEVCSRDKEMFEEMSGTSMATPIVSRIAAEVWMARPSLTPPEVIQALKGMARVDSSRQFLVYRLKAKLPSWYRLFDVAPNDDGFYWEERMEKVLGALSLPEALPTPQTASARRGFEFLVGNTETL